MIEEALLRQTIAALEKYYGELSEQQKFVSIKITETRKSINALCEIIGVSPLAGGGRYAGLLVTAAIRQFLSDGKAYSANEITEELKEGGAKNTCGGYVYTTLSRMLKRGEVVKVGDGTWAAKTEKVELEEINQ